MKLLEVHLQTHKVEALQAFYRDAFGLATAQESNGAFSFQTGTTRTFFHPVNDQSEPFYHFAFNIPENQFEAAKTWMEQRAPLLTHNAQDWIHFERINAHSVYCYDPAGNIVELIARHDLHNASDAEFGSDSILEMSEIGLPVPNVEAYVPHLCAATGMDVWRLSSINDTLTFVGQEDGMFIVVVQDRDWLMTKDPAVPYPVTALVEGRGKDFTDAERGYHIRFSGILNPPTGGK